MISTLECRSTPARNAALVPGSLVSRSRASWSIPSAAQRVSASAAASSVSVNSSQLPGSASTGSQPGSGRRRISSATAACLSAHAAASVRSSPQMIPVSSSSVAPANRPPSPAACSA